MLRAELRGYLNELYASWNEPYYGDSVDALEQTLIRYEGNTESEARHNFPLYFDSSWADDKDDSRSTFGYVILYGSTPLLWKSKKHKLSATVAEYLAATEATREICWVLNLFKGMQLEVALLVMFPSDNENANSLGTGLRQIIELAILTYAKGTLQKKQLKGLSKSYGYLLQIFFFISRKLITVLVCTTLVVV